MCSLLCGHSGYTGEQAPFLWAEETFGDEPEWREVGGSRLGLEMLGEVSCEEQSCEG